MEVLWKLFGSYLENVEVMFGSCLEVILEVVWKSFGSSLMKVFWKKFGSVFTSKFLSDLETTVYGLVARLHSFTYRIFHRIYMFGAAPLGQLWGLGQWHLHHPRLGTGGVWGFTGCTPIYNQGPYRLGQYNQVANP